jgi:hypothetical protein
MPRLESVEDPLLQLGSTLEHEPLAAFPEIVQRRSRGEDEKIRWQQVQQAFVNGDLFLRPRCGMWVVEDEASVFVA